jgi:formylglycine-generating enzyme required for sulfatase activity
MVLSVVFVTVVMADPSPVIPWAFGGPRAAAAEEPEESTASAALWLEAMDGFGTGDLAAVARSAAKLEELDAPESRAAESLLEARRTTLEGFHALVHGLDLARARKGFTKAAESLKDVRGAERALAYIAACQARLEKLSRLVAPMAPVPRGNVQIRVDGLYRAVPVEPFFVDRAVVSAGDYAEFAAAQREVETYADVSLLWPDEETFEAQGRGRNLLPSGFWKAAARNPQQPVEGLEPFQARACLLWRGKDLPSRAEHILAAKAGLPSLFALPEEADVASRGPSSLERAGPRDGSTQRAQDLLAELPIRREDGEGLRGVLRPREFFRDLLPR